MPSLKALRTRINSVKSTRKITQAMKMVAASKLKRAQTQAEQARPYAERMERMLGALAASVAGSPIAPPMLVGTGKSDVHLLVVVSADRGLCGGFNTAVGAKSAAEYPNEVSPIHWASRIKQPLLVYAGADDIRTPLEQTSAMVSALERAGNPPKKVIIKPEEGHGFGKVENNVELYNAILEFLDAAIGAKSVAAK